MIDKALYHEDYAEIDLDTASKTLESVGQAPPTIAKIITYLAAAPSKVILVDNTSADDLAEAYPSFLRQGISIVTPNKKAFSGSYDLWQDISAAIGAGLPVISTLKDLIETGDEITRIEGILSGTLSFLFNSFSPTSGTGSRWSAEVKRAKELGYTEPDPRDDLNGLDVARKLTILARLAGLPIESPTSFPVQSLIPKELEAVVSGNEFLNRLPEFDNQMEVQKAGKVLHYVGSIDMASKQIKVGLEWFDPVHPIGRLKGSDNIFSFYTKRYGDRPLILQGVGAGGEVTAMGVASDLLKAVSRMA
ncbi:homoserine dehydrogenase domain-containing protein [Trichoderma velutinum]